MEQVGVITEASTDRLKARAAAMKDLRGPQFEAGLAGSSGARLRLNGVLRPVIALGDGVLRGRAVSRAVSLAQPDGRLSPATDHQLNAVDLERLDIAVMEQAFAATAVTPSGDRPPLLILPLSWSSLRSPRTRRKLLRLAAAAQVRLRNLVLCEVTGVEPGTPQSALREAAGQLQPIFRGVLARATWDRKVIRDLSGCGFSGATVEAVDLGDAEDAAAMLRTVLALQKIGPSVMVHAVRSVTGLSAVRAAGANWASLDIVPGALESLKLAAETKTAAGETPTAV